VLEPVKNYFTKELEKFGKKLTVFEGQMGKQETSAANMHAYSKIPDLLKESLLKIDSMSNQLVTDTKLQQFEHKLEVLNAQREERLALQIRRDMEIVNEKVLSRQREQSELGGRETVVGILVRLELLE